MTTNLSTITVGQLALGDILTLDDGTSLTVRALINLQLPAASTSGFVILGEFEIALGIPALQSTPASVCIPRDRAALKGKSVQIVAEGATRYWPPHRPAVPGAMTAVKFRVISVRGQETPVLVCFRGPEPVVFSRNHSVWTSEVSATAMGVGAALDGAALPHQTGEVLIDPSRPAASPAAPERAPARAVPAPVN